MKKLILALSIIVALVSSSPALAKPESWYAKLAAAPLQLTHHNAYTLTGCITTPIALYAAGYLHMVYANLDKVMCDGSIPTEVKNMIYDTHPLVASGLLVALWAGITYTAGSLTKSNAKALMNVFDIPELK